MGNFTYGVRAIPDDQPVRNVFVFCCLMSARVAAVRGGENSQYLRECGDFLTDVVGSQLSVTDPLPPEFDWTPPTAVECADAMMEYDAS